MLDLVWLNDCSQGGREGAEEFFAKNPLCPPFLPVKTLVWRGFSPKTETRVAGFMDLRQLESLLAVMESPTMTRAAETLHLSTAAVSLQLQALAAELNTQLFARSGRKLVPTPAAHRVAEHARNVMAQLRSIRQE